jgi:hypothetical protein
MSTSREIHDVRLDQHREHHSPALVVAVEPPVACFRSTSFAARSWRPLLSRILAQRLGQNLWT